jgi:hypothetical protein
MSKRAIRLTSAVLLAILLTTASAARAQVVQLPTFQFFSIDTSVMVPDQGTASLGGVNRSSTGSNQFGSPFFPSNRSYGSQTAAAGMSVSVKIHDFEAMDAALLGGTPEGAGRAGRDGVVAGNPAGGSGPLASVAELAARKATTQAAEQAEAEQLLERGLKAQAEGKPGVAKVYLQMAAKRSTGKLKQQVLAALGSGNHSSSASATPRVSQNHGNRSSTGATTPVRN